MNIKTLLLAVSGLLIMIPQIDAKKPEKPAGITVMSYNIRNSGGEDGTNSWQYRYPASAMMIDDLKPDAIGIQEALPDQVGYLKEVLKKQYSQVGVGRDDGKKKGEFMLVLYNKKTTKLLKWGTFWLSETPDEPSKGWDAACRRTATWTLLKDKKSGKRYFFVDTHLDHRGTEARKNGLQLIMDRIASINPEGLPLVLAGDFNMTIDDPSMAPVKAAMNGARETAMKTDASHTFHGWGRTAKAIDYVWYKGFSSCPEYETVTKSYLDRAYISDHYPVKAYLLF